MILSDRRDNAHVFGAPLLHFFASDASNSCSKLQRMELSNGETGLRFASELEFLGIDGARNLAAYSERIQSTSFPTSIVSVVECSTRRLVWRKNCFYQ